MTGLRAGRSRVRIPLWERDLFTNASTGLRGVSWRVRLRTRIRLVPTLIMWRYTSTPTGLRGVHIDDGADTIQQDTGQRNLPSGGT